MAAVEKIEEQRKPEDFFGYRNKGNSRPSAYIGTVYPQGVRHIRKAVKPPTAVQYPQGIRHIRKAAKLSTAVQG